MVLVITIIVLLILAGVSLSFVIGSDSIISRATDASEAIETSQIKEMVETSIVSCQSSYIGDAGDLENWLTTADLNVELNAYSFWICKSIDDSTESVSNSELVSEKEYIYVTSEDGIIYAVKISGTSVVEVLTAGNDSSENSSTENSDLVDVATIEIGMEVKNYSVDESIQNVLDSEGITWKIFYIDDDNTYLISSDYIPSSLCPNGIGGTAITKNSNYKVSFTDVINDYPDATYIYDEKIQSLNSSFFNYSNYILNNSNTNIRAVAYMLDSSIWKGFVGSYADYAIGGPTIEMLLDSYNEKNQTNYLTKATNSYGYTISIDGGLAWIDSIGASGDTITDVLTDEDGLYIINSSSKASAMWIASPSATSENNVMRLTYFGSLGSGEYYYSYPGIRPVVCLSSDVQFEVNSDGVYISN